MAFICGMLTMIALQQMQRLYFRQYRIQRIAYELLPPGKYWNFDFDETERAHYLMRASEIYDIAKD